MSEKKRGRRKQYDGPPVSLRVTKQMYDDLCAEALRRRIDMTEVMRERLAQRPNSYLKSRPALATAIH